MTSLEHHTRRSAIHVAIILAIGTLTIAALASEHRQQRAYDDYLQKLDSRIERVESRFLLPFVAETPALPLRHDRDEPVSAAHGGLLERLA